MNNTVYFAIPGDPATLTGGYGYDRELLAGLRAQGLAVQPLALSASFPAPDAAALAAAESSFAALPDSAVVLIDGLAYGVMPGIARQHGKRLRLVALCHHPLALESGLDSETVTQLLRSEQLALAGARAVLVTSASTARSLTEHYGVPDAKITVAVPGTNRRPFAMCLGNPPRLLTVATLTRRKAHDVLIKALSRLRALPWRARFVGGMEFDPAWAATLQQLVAEHGLQQRITFTGAISDLTAEYQQADIFVLPSRHEGFGMACAEALASGVPVVAAFAGAVPDLVPESAGILVPPNDDAALAAALDWLLTQPALRLLLREGARTAATNLPDWSSTAAVVANLIRSLP